MVLGQVFVSRNKIKEASSTQVPWKIGFAYIDSRILVVIAPGLNLLTIGVISHTKLDINTAAASKTDLTSPKLFPRGHFGVLSG
jgi:hypothetical protein